MFGSQERGFIFLTAPYSTLLAFSNTVLEVLLILMHMLSTGLAAEDI